jgi:hypothetical protein
LLGVRLNAFRLPLVVAALGLAACGDDSNDPDDFVSDADAICTDAASQLADASLAQPSPPLNAKDIVTLYEAQNPHLVDAQAQLSKLDAPDEVSADWDEYLSLNQQRIDAREKAVAAADDSKDVYAAVDDGLAALDKRDRVGAQIGLGACADVLSDSDQQAVTAREDEFAAAEDTEQICNEIFLPQYVDYVYGDIQKCIDDPVTGKAVEQDISKISGVDGVRAQVELELTAGQPSLEGHPITDEWYYVDGEWRLYQSIIE